MKRTHLKRSGSIRAKPKKRAPKDERLHMSLVAAMPCLVCGAWPVEVHHVHSDGYQRLARTNKRVVPLCSVAHRTGKFAVHVIGHAAFNERNGFDLLAIADRLWREFEDLNNDRG